jgi:glycosyltransferase involved in cell wall biosynthesis
MLISFAVCTHNEGRYVHDLLGYLGSYIQVNEGRDNVFYEIVVIDDFSDEPVTATVLEVLEKSERVRIHKHALNGDFATHKNYMNHACRGDWILNLDADESIPWDVLDLLPALVEENPNVEAYWLPRVNTVHGLTQAHVDKWGWKISKLHEFVEKFSPSMEEVKLLEAHKLIIDVTATGVVAYVPIIQWPDPQLRFYKNDSKIHWVNKVHEQLVGYTAFGALPVEPDYAIRHHKTIDRQEHQNSFYESIR